jgi:hypothetical protein
MPQGLARNLYRAPAGDALDLRGHHAR